MRNLTIIVEKDRGVFLGLYSRIALFSKNDVTESTKAFGFRDKEEAEKFITTFLPDFEQSVEYVDIPTDDFSYVDVVDIIKAGYADYAKDLFMNLPTVNDTIH